MYTSAGNNSVETFTEEADNFEAYHKGFRQQVKQWPINPLDIIIKSIRKRSDLNELVVADFGCGEARLSAEISSVAKKVVSFDLMAANSRVKVCDVRNTPLPSKSIDILVYCLSLMASSLNEHFKEANRVLKIGGTMKIAEVESRFVNVDRFIEDIKHFGFELQSKNFSYNLFFFMDFKKVSDISKSKKKKLPDVSLLPCIYKKR
ncbi:ribosomal RNA-processing protein 8 isoform X2 [Rhodnius prolixus]